MSRAAFMVNAPRTSALRALNYAQEVELVGRGRPGRFRPIPLRSLLENLGSSYGRVFTRRDCTPDHGVQLISQSDMFAAEPNGRVIRRDSMPRPSDHEVKLWQVLIAGAGQMGGGNLFGRSIIADARLVGRFLGPDTVALEFRDPGGLLNLWTYAFLNTSLGIKAIKACAYGTSIPHLRLDLLSDVPIPIPENRALLERVGKLLRRCVEQREIYLRELRSARRIIETLPDMIEANDVCHVRRAHAVSWEGELPTLCAWTFASTGGALALLKRRWHGRFCDVLEGEGVFNGPRFARIPCDPPHGIEFMSQRDSFLIRQFSRRIVHPGVPDRLLFVRKGTILVGGHGTLGEGEIFGRAILAHGRFLRTGFTQDMLRIVAKQSHAPTLFAFLTTLVGLRLLRSTAVGTKILSMRPDLLLALPIPELCQAKSRDVENHVLKSVAARQESEDAEQEASRIIEGEVLPAWLA